MSFFSFPYKFKRILMTVQNKKKSPFKIAYTNTQFYLKFCVCTFFLYKHTKKTSRKKIITSLYTQHIHNQSLSGFSVLWTRTRVFYIDNPPTKHEKKLTLFCLFLLLLSCRIRTKILRFKKNVDIIKVNPISLTTTTTTRT